MVEIPSYIRTWASQFLLFLGGEEGRVLHNHHLWFWVHKRRHVWNSCADSVIIAIDFKPAEVRRGVRYLESEAVGRILRSGDSVLAVEVTESGLEEDGEIISCNGLWNFGNMHLDKEKIRVIATGLIVRYQWKLKLRGQRTNWKDGTCMHGLWVTKYVTEVFSRWGTVR